MNLRALLFVVLGAVAASVTAVFVAKALGASNPGVIGGGVGGGVAGAIGGSFVARQRKPNAG